MGRGLGQMQRAVLGILHQQGAFSIHYGTASCWEHQHWNGMRRIAKEIAGRDLNPELLAVDHSLIESVRRAIKTLERRGLAEVGYLWYDTHNPDEKWRAELDGSGLHARLTAAEWETVTCRICTIGPCVGPVRGQLLRGSRSAEFACRDTGDAVGRLQAALGAP